MPDRTSRLTLNIGDREYRLSIDASGPAGDILDGRVMEDGREVFTIHSTAEDEAAIQRTLLAEALRRSGQQFAERAGPGDWTCEADEP